MKGRFALRGFAKNDFAKYPFLKAAARYVRRPDLSIDDLADPELGEILKRAKERIEEAVLDTRITRQLRKEDIEILSYPAAILLATATESSFVKRRYALAEAKQSYEDLEFEKTETILGIAQDFGLKLALNDNPKVPFQFKLDFTDYLRNASHLRDKKWKLVNRLLSDSYVFLTGKETARLLSEEVRRRIEERFKETAELPRLPPLVMKIAENIKKLAIEEIGKSEMEVFPRTVSQSAFPPCIENLYEAISLGRHLSHIGRFTLTSFLLSIGVTVDEVIELFRSSSDYSERMTRYQAEHVAGEKGSRTRYVPPKCDTLKTHGVCKSPDEVCQRVHHPLAYYRMKLK